jgi:cell division protein FtsZ
MAQQVDPAIETFAKILVVGVGGAGGAAINRMVEAGVTGVDFI